MKILTVMPYSPVPAIFGGALREYYILKSLASEHDVTLLTYGDEERKKMFYKQFEGSVDELCMVSEHWERRHRRLAQLCSLWSSDSFYHSYNCSAEMQEKINQYLGQGDFDAIHFEFSTMANYDIRADIDIIKVTDTHNVEYENFRRMWQKSSSPVKKWFYGREYPRIFEEEIEALSKQDVIFSTSEDDRAIIKSDVPDVPNYVVPNGVDTSYFKPNPSVELEPHSIVFTGMMGYTPNHDGMHYFLDDIFPHILEQVPDAKVYIVGKSPPQDLKNRSSSRVEVTGFVDDVRPYVWQSSVFVVPLRMGSGTRLKVVEALAMQKPVVSTSRGCEGINVEDGKSILIEDSPKAFADSVVQLFKDEDLRSELTANGYRVIKNHYEWERIGDKMLEVYNSLSSEIDRKEERQLASENI